MPRTAAPSPRSTVEGVLAAPLDEARPAPLPVGTRPLQPDLSWQVAPDDNRFLAAVALAREEIRAGQCFQIVLSRRWSRPSPASPIALYRALRLANPSPYMFFLALGGDRHVVGTSPEKLVQVETGAIETRPLAGTRRRGADPADDARLARELLDRPQGASRARDAGRPRAQRRGVASRVRVRDGRPPDGGRAVLPCDAHLRDGERAAARGPNVPRRPACSVPGRHGSGAPKIRAMEVIADLEPDRRGVYAGSPRLCELRRQPGHGDHSAHGGGGGRRRVRAGGRG